MDVQEAVDAFSNGFAQVRSITHPFEYVRYRSLGVLRDKTPRRHDPRNIEFTALDLEPSKVLREVASYKPSRYIISCINTLDEDLDIHRDAYKRAGYRLMNRYRLMVATGPRDPFVSSHDVRRATTLEEIEVLNKANRKRLAPKNMALEDDAPYRLCYARVGDELAGWVRAISTGTSVYVAGVFVYERYRRQGLGREMMSLMLADDSRLGYARSALVSNSTGALLYPNLGYEKIATMQMFSVPKTG